METTVVPEDQKERRRLTGISDMIGCLKNMEKEYLRIHSEYLKGNKRGTEEECRLKRAYKPLTDSTLLLEEAISLYDTLDPRSEYYSPDTKRKGLRREVSDQIELLVNQAGEHMLEVGRVWGDLKKANTENMQIVHTRR